MALSPTQEAQVLQLVAEQAALLSLADNEATIISKLGATKVNLSSLGSAATFDDADIMLIRQGTTDLSVAGSVVKAAVAVPDASETVKGKVELATSAETIAGTSTILAVHPAGVAAALSGISSIKAATRQTVMSGSVDANGNANYLSAGTGLTINLSAAAVPITISFSHGFDTNGAIDRIGIVSADVSAAWTVPASITSFLYTDRNSTTGALTRGSTTLEPKYGYGIAKSTVNGQHTFRIDEWKMYVGNGSTAIEVDRVFDGECVSGVSSITSVSNYALRGIYSSNRFAVAASMSYGKNHKIGVPPDFLFFASKGSATIGGALCDFNTGFYYNGTSNVPGWCGVHAVTRTDSFFSVGSIVSIINGFSTAPVPAEAIVFFSRSF